MVTLKWIQDFHLAFEPMGVYMNTICSNVPIPEECMSVCLVIRYVSVFFFQKLYFNPHTLLNGIICFFFCLFVCFLMGITSRFHYSETNFFEVMSSLPAQGYFVFGDLEIMWAAADA